MGRRRENISTSTTVSLLTSHVGPQGETHYEYDAAGRMTAVELPNETTGSIAYTVDGRVESVTVDPAGADPAKTTHFDYSEEPRRTAVTPPDNPIITYDIAADGSILRWWNTPQPPDFADLAGTLYANKETAAPIATGDHNFVVQAHSEEGIASIQLIANGSTLVDEKYCEQDLQTPGVECVDLINEWVTHTADLSPGILYLEVLTTDRIGDTASQRFWVNIPYTPPPAIGAPVPPKFSEVLRFREEHGLDLDLDPATEELEINDRVFDLIGWWHNPYTPLGEVARASYERWGVPLRPVDVGELEYRLAYQAEAAAAIPAWAESNALSTYAGYYIDERAGGLIHVGFTANQPAQLNALKAATALPAPARIYTFQATPANSLSGLRSLQSQVATLATGSQPGLITDAAIDVQASKVVVGSSNVGQATSLLASNFGASAPLAVTFQAVARPRREGRERVSGPIKAGDWIRLLDNATGSVKEKLVGSECTAAVGAFDQAQSPQGVPLKRMFVLTAGHCMEAGHEVIRRSDPSQAEKQWIGTVRREGLDETGSSTDVDAAAIRLENPEIVPRKIYTAANSAAIPVKSIGVGPGVGTNICFSGITSNEVRCGPIYTQPIFGSFGEGTNANTVEVCFTEYIADGDSGAPAWIEGTGTVVGLMTTGFDATESPIPVACFEPLKPYPGYGPDSAALTNDGMAPLHLVISP